MARAARHRVLVDLWLVLLLGLASTKLWAQPANNNIANATIITGASGTLTGSNVNANKQTGEPNHAGDDGGASVWFAWTAPGFGSVTAAFTTEGSGFNTLLAIYRVTGAVNVNNLTQVLTNDNANGSVTFSRVTTNNFVGGTTYYIAVDGFNAGFGVATGNYVLSWGPPSNNNYANSLNLGTGTSGVRINEVNVGATLEAGEPQILGDGGGASVWYLWRAPSVVTGPVTFSTAGSSLDTQIGVYVNAGSVGALGPAIAADDNSAGSGDSRVVFTPLADTFYRIQVDGKANPTNAIPPAASERSFNLIWGAGPGNDDLANAYNLDSPPGLGPTVPLSAGTYPYVTNNLGGTIQTTLGEDVNMPNIAGQPVNSTIWWTWTAPFNGFVRFDTAGSTFDTLLAVYTNNAAPAAPSFTTLQLAQTFDALTSTYGFAEDDDGGTGVTSQTLPVWVEKGRIYYIRVGGKAGAEGLVRLNWAPALVSNPSGDNANGVNPIPLPTDTGSMAPQSFTSPLQPSTVGATKQSGEMNHGGTNDVPGQYGGASIWYSYTPTVDGLATFDTTGSGFNTVMAAYTRLNNVFANYTWMAGNDDDPAAAPATTSRISFPVTAGTTYYIAVDGFARTNLTVSTVDTNLEVITTSTAHGLSTNAPVLFSATGLLPAPLASNVTYYAVPVSATQFRVSSTSDGLSIVDLTTAGTGARTVAYVDAPAPNFVSLGPVQLNWTLAPQPVYSRGAAGNFKFTTATYTATERELSRWTDQSNIEYLGAPITVTRTGSAVGRVLVKYRTIEPPDPRAGTGLPNVDYVPASGTLVFNDWDMSQTFVVRPIYKSGVISDTPTVNIEITEAVVDDGRLGTLPDAVSEIRPPTLSAQVATLTITDVDFGFNFERFNFRYDEGQAIAPVRVFRGTTGTFDPGDSGRAGQVQYRIIHRTGGRTLTSDEEMNFFSLQAGSDYASPDTDFTIISGTLSWGNDFSTRTINVPVIDDTLVEFNEDLLLELFFSASPPPTGHFIGASGFATATILFDRGWPNGSGEQTAGAVDRTHNVDYDDVGFDMAPPLGAFADFSHQDRTTDPPFNTAPGANGPVFAVAVDASQRTVLGGDFTAFNTFTRKKIARMLNSGQIDKTFDPGNGIDGGFVTALAIQPDGKVVVGGGFSAFNNFGRNNIVRLNDDGSVDATFNPGTGLNNAVRAVALYTNGTGKIMVGGDFTTANSTNRNFIARLDSNGVMDNSFEPKPNANNEGGPLNGPVHAIVIQSDGKIIIGGEFTALGSTPARHIARLNDDGSMDTSFNPGDGADDIVFALGLDSNQKIYLGGSFKSVDLRSRNAIARLNADGSLDTAFDPQAGANDSVFAIAMQPDNKPIIAGLFTSYNTTRRMGIARLYTTGELDTTFMDTAFNHFAGMVKVRAIDPQPPILALALESNGNVIIGGAFTQVGGGFLRDDVRQRWNVARLIGGANAPGAAPGNIEFANSSYSWGEAQNGMFVLLQRVNGNLAGAGVSLTPVAKPAGPGVATPGTDYAVTTYLPTWSSLYNRNGFASLRMVTDSYQGPNNDTVVNWAVDDAYVTVNNNSIIQGDRTLNLALALTNSFTLLGGVPSWSWPAPSGNGEVIPIGVALGRSSVPMTIVEDDLEHGTLGFTSPTFTVNENGGNAVVTVTRTNGFAGTVTIQYVTADGTNNPANAGVDYTSRSGTLTFNSGVTNQTLQIPIVNDTGFEPDETILIRLSNPTGGAVTNNAVLPVTAVLTILDDDFAPGRLTFTSPTYTTNESGVAAIISVARTGGSVGSVSVEYATTDGSANTATNTSLPYGPDYQGVTNTLVWVNGDVSVKTFAVPIVSDRYVEGTETVNLALRNPVNGILGAVTSAVLSITDDDNYGQFSFNSANYNANENGGVVTVTILRTGGDAQPVSVDVQTVDLTATVDTGTETFTVAAGHGLTDGSQVTFAVGGADTLPDNITAGTPYYLTNATATTFQVATAPGGSVVAVGPSAGTGTLFVVSSDYGAVPVKQLDFADGQVSTNITITLTNNAITESNRTFLVRLSNPQGGASLGSPANATVTIIDDETFNVPAGSVDTAFSAAAAADNFVLALALQADQKLMVGGAFTTINGFRRNRIARLEQNGDFDPTFVSGTGFNNSVLAIAVHTNGFNTNRIVVGGQFTNYNGTNVNRLARLNADGSFDATFNIGSGPDGVVSAVLIQPDGKVLIGGSFASVNTLARSGVARLLTNGVVDSAFATGTGANGAVSAVALQSDGKVVIGGSFTTYNNVSRNGVARLNADGTLDTSFNPGIGADGVVRAVALQSTGKIIIGGSFTSFNGSSRSFLARLNPDGSLDAAFDTSGLNGGDASVLGMAVEDDDDLVVVGNFARFGNVTRNRITRLKADGTTDPTINFGVGANDFINAVVLPANHRTILIGGGFTEFDGVPKNYLARLHGGAIAGVGSVEYLAPVFSVVEGAANATITVRRRGGTQNLITVTNLTSDVTAIAGTNYVGLTNALLFPSGETVQTFNLQIIDDSAINADRYVRLDLKTNATDGATLGFQPFAFLIITNDDSLIEFAAATFDVSENTGVGAATITVVRSGGMTGAATVDFLSTTNGTSTSGLDFVPVSGTLQFAAGETIKTFSVPIFDDSLVEGNESVELVLTNFTGLGRLGQSSAILTILDNDAAPGVLTFSAANYSTNESFVPVDAVITVVRTNGSTGLVTVNYATSDDGTVNAAKGGVAQGTGIDYQITSGRLSFADGETVKTFTVKIYPDTLVETNETLNITLSGPTGGAALGGQSTARLTIVNNNILKYGNLVFSSSSYTNNEGDGVATITVNRIGSTNNQDAVSVMFATSDATALSGIHYQGSTNVLTWAASNATPQVVNIPLTNNLYVDRDKTVNLALFGATNLTLGVADDTLLGTLTNAVLVIKDDDTSSGVIGFSLSSYSTNENGVNAVLTILRTNGFTGDVTVDFSTRDGTARAGGSAPADYATNQSVVILTNGQTSTNVNVVIHDNSTQEGNRNFTARLAKPTRRFILPGGNNDFEITVITTTAASGNPVKVVFDNASAVAVASAGYDPTNKTLTITNRLGLATASEIVTALSSLDDFQGAFEGDGSGAVGILADADLPVLGIATADVTILDDEAPAGSRDTGFNTGTGANGTIHSVVFVPSSKRLVLGGEFTTFNGVGRTNVARLLENGTLDLNFNPPVITLNGTNGTVRAVGVHSSGPDAGKVVIAGLFDSVNGLSRNNIARLNADGTLDGSFATGLGVNNAINAVAVRPDGHILIGGSFTAVNGTGRNFIARLNSDGSLDGTFDPGSGANAPVRALAVDANGLVVIGGDFTAVNDVVAGHVARLRSDGGVDKTFDPGMGTDGVVRAVAVQNNGQLLFGGEFTSLDGTNVLNRIARLNADGTVDAGFMAAVTGVKGVDDFVAAIAVQADDRILLGGAFSTVNGITNVNRIVRLSANGLQDPTFNIGTGANNLIASLALQADGKVVAVGAFTNFNGAAHNRIVRLHGGENIGSGNLSFISSAFTLNENGLAALISVQRTRGTTNRISVDYATSDGTGLAYPGSGSTDGFHYTNTFGTLVFEQGETLKTFLVPVIDNTNILGNTTVNLSLFNPTNYIIGVGTNLDNALLAAPTNAVLTIVDDDGIVGFASASYSVNENAGTATITVLRDGGVTRQVSVDFTTVNDVTNTHPAQAGFDYISTTRTLTFLPGQTSASVSVPILNDTLIEGNETVKLQLSNPTNVVLGLTDSTLTIIDDEFQPGILLFSTNNFVYSEGATNAVITVIRTNGTTGAVSVDYSTSDGTALAGLDYQSVARTLSFADGESVKTFLVPIIDDPIVDNNELESLNLILSNPSGGVSLSGAGTFGELDPDFNLSLGPDSTLNVMALQPNGSILIGGNFTSVDGIGAGRIARLNVNGSVDTSFNPGLGVNGAVQAIALHRTGTNTGRVVIGGSFTTFDGTNAANRLAQLNANGSLDTNFTIGAGVNNTIRSIAIYGGTSTNAGKIVIAGDFSTVSGATRNRLARLSGNGTLETTFNAAGGFNGTINAVAIQNDGSVVVGGVFNTFDTNNTVRNVARLLADGTLDAAFNTNLNALGPNGAVNSIAIQGDGKILLAGAFSAVNGTSRNFIARLNTDGTLDATFDPGVGPDASVNTVLVQPNGAIVIGGGFSTVNGISRMGIERLTSTGTRDSTFDPGAGANAVVNALLVQPDTKLLIGGAFTMFNGTPINRVARLQAGAAFGLALSTLTIVDNDIAIGFSTNDFQVSESALTQTVTVTRSGLSNLTFVVDFTTVDGTAFGTLDYVPTNGSLTFGPNETNKTFEVALLNDSIVEGNEVLNLRLTGTGGANLTGLTNASLTILDDDVAFDLATGISVVEPVYVGSNFVYTVSVTNLGPSSVTGVSLTNALPLAVQFNSQTNTLGLAHVQSGNVLTFDLGTLTNGAVATFTLFATATNPVSSVVTNVAAILPITLGTATDSNTNNNVSTNTLLIRNPSPFVRANLSQSTVTSESQLPANGAIDPGETVTVNLALENVGNQNTVGNIVAALLATNGVTAPSGAMDYGPLAVGQSVTRPFSFTAAGTNGQTIVATLYLTNNGVFLSNNIVLVPFTLGASTNFANPSSIVIPDVGAALSPNYPSTIVVSNLNGIVGKVTVTLNNLTHGYPADLDLLLASPSGERVVIMSDAGGGPPNRGVTNVTITLDDDAIVALPSSSLLTNGTYRPFDYTDPNTDVFPTPAPAGPYATNLAAFNGINPNGTWSLFVVDDSTGDAGAVANGWTLTITAIDPVSPTAGLGLGMTSATNSVLVGDTVVYTMVVTNIGPDSATGVKITNTFPAGVSFVAATNSAGVSFVPTGNTVVFDVGTLLINQASTNRLVVIPRNAGTIVNQASVSAAETDSFPPNNAASLSTTVVPSANLLVSMGVTNFIAYGANLTNVITVQNLGPSTATSILLTNTFPATASFVVASSSQGAVSAPVGNVITASLGTLASNASATVTIVSRPNSIGSVTNTASVGSPVFDADTISNTASAVSTVGASADVAVSITNSPNPVVVTSNLTYTITVTNLGLSAATNVVMTDTLPGSLTFVSVSASQGSSTSSGGVITCNLGNLAAGAAATVTIQVRPTAIGPVNNTVFVSASTADPNSANNSATVITTVNDRSVEIVIAGSTLVSETNGIVNGAVDPGETVTIAFGLRNKGGTDTTNLVATLLGTGGVVTNSPQSQVYGQLSTNTVRREFTFTANGNYGDTLLASLQLQDGVGGTTTNLGTVIFPITLGAVNAFSNTAQIVILDPSLGVSVPASPYPSVINVSNLAGTIIKVSVTLSNLNHNYPDDVDILLESPTGQSIILMSDAGGGYGVGNLTLTFDDDATASLPDAAQMANGAYKPSNFLNASGNPATTNDTFVAPAPQPAAGTSYATNLMVLRGANPNGAWKLYAVDDFADPDQPQATIADGWSLRIISVATISPSVDLAVSLTNSPTLALVGSNLTYTAIVTNHGPNTATNVVLTNILPASVSFVSAAGSQGTITSGGGVVTFNIGTLLSGTKATNTVIVTPTASGSITLTSVVSSAQTELVSANNTAINTVTVLPVDLGIAMTGSPNPVGVSSNVTFVLVVTNLSSGNALGVKLTNTLPGTVSFVSATPAQGSATNVGNVVTFDLGTLLSGASVTNLIVVKANFVGSFTNAVVVSAPPQAETNLINNMATVVVTVDGVQFDAASSGVTTNGSFQLNLLGHTNKTYVIEVSTNLVNWTPIFTNSTLSGALNFIDTNAPNFTARFYRAVER